MKLPVENVLFESLVCTPFERTVAWTAPPQTFSIALTCSDYKRSRYSTPNSRRSFIGTRARCATRPHDATSRTPKDVSKGVMLLTTSALRGQGPLLLMAAIPTHARSNSERGLKLPHLSLLVSALLPLDPATHPPHPIMSDLEARVQKILDDATSSGGPVGCTFAAIDRKGEILVNVASGYEELGNHSRPAKPDSLYCLYSCTKAIATIAVMQLVEQGKISLDDHVGDKVLQVAAATLADGTKPNKPITLRHLLTHTAGFGYTFFSPELKRWSERAGIDEFAGTLEGITSPLIAQPGEDWNYGVNIDWAGIYLEKVTGMTLGAYCKKHVFEPLGADDIEFGLLPQNKDRLVAMHQRGEDGTMTVRKHLDFTYKSSFDSAGAGCIGSIESYLKCVSILMNDGVGANGTRILKAETVQQMLQDHLGDVRTFSGADPMERKIPAANPELTHPIEMMPGVKKGWGLSFQILQDDLPHGRKAGSVWWAGLCNNYWQVDPTSGIATMILSQSFPFNDPKAIVPWITAEAEVYKSLRG
ncbi:hypothetical protein C6P46_003293 [Rhodotorula mucilaginosa]|uniref:Beta-lactamase-related domain-containing protein n=1 Tax=Rhodotorula mucilaginosa TaxID=5537 RepID=A0A9P6W598_RHOMI|nr:hypothetical protein C6P46_003293 [Rhodotorula mucilaginosa]